MSRADISSEIGHHTTASSTPIQSLTYLPDEQVLEVVFNSGQSYLYENVPPGIPKLLTDAEAVNRHGGRVHMSVGSLFHHLVKLHPDKYPCYRVVEGVPVPVSPPSPPRRPRLRPRDTIRKLLDQVKR